MLVSAVEVPQHRDRRRLKFNGTGGQLFGKWILWCLLCIVTVGIYTIWMPVKLLEWETKHVEIDSVA